MDNKSGDGHSNHEQNEQCYSAFSFFRCGWFWCVFFLTALDLSRFDLVVIVSGYGQFLLGSETVVGWGFSSILIEVLVDFLVLDELWVCGVAALFWTIKLCKGHVHFGFALAVFALLVEFQCLVVVLTGRLFV